ncbi:DUF1513 domain-containing protein [Amylibacter sp. SFDW26]|uniref:DUF1513 domain-containing protein n=1 Tax=Amylibacter sp. SFDW26 TaxID=2652722 RepID=UPI0012619CAC|nr:DUF1513 domain-containing protein [Amylibacter sp. SFDW26]KAB7615190.1 DUF1513 domain-containing protein [Amylibacter sp. SFDW26]
MTNRRTFLAGLLAASTTPKLTWADAGSPSYLAAAKLHDGTFSLFGLSNEGQDIFQIPLPARGHAAAVHPIRPEAVAFARRPGRFALVINCATGQLIQKLDAPSERHFYGHGAFINNGEILCTSENNIETGKGVVGLWARSENYRRIGEFYSGGIGPHELKTMPDDQTIVIANGGIRTHPDSGREKLNLETMCPNLSIINFNGSIIENLELDKELRHNSIRHLDVSTDGKVAFGMQWEGDETEIVPLLGVMNDSREIELLSAPIEYQVALKSYIGSVAISARNIGITAPRGGKVHIYSNFSKFQKSVSRSDISGISANQTGFLTTDGNGRISQLYRDVLKPIRATQRLWDNHLVKVNTKSP